MSPRRRPLLLTLVLFAPTACAPGAGPADPAPDEDAAVEPETPPDRRRPTTDASASTPEVAPADAAARDAAAADAAAVDGAGDGPDAAPSSDCKGARVCDDFEAYAAGAAPGGTWTVSVSKGGRLVVDGAKAYSGTKSILVTTPGMTASAWMKNNRAVFPLPDNVIHGRMMTFLTAAPKGGVHWNSIQAGGNRPDDVYALYQWGAMYEKVMANYWKPDCAKSSRTLWPTGRWACVQWQFDGSANADGTGRKNEMRFWLDGQPLSDVTVVRYGTSCVGADPKTNEWVAPVFTNLQLGWENYQTSPIPIELWIDDVAVDARPIACPPPR